MQHEVSSVQSREPFPGCVDSVTGRAQDRHDLLSKLRRAVLVCPDDVMCMLKSSAIAAGNVGNV